MAPLNIIGELAKVVSISFRLFGNIMGGGIIIIVVSHLVYQLVLPPFLYAFFGIFVVDHTGICFHHVNIGLYLRTGQIGYLDHGF